MVVQKKDRKLQFYTDFRMLNMLTFKYKFLMPTLGSLFLYMAYKKKTIWSALDLLSGYHQCAIEEGSRSDTPFEIPMGVYQYRRVPLGLISALWQFTKVMAISKGILFFPFFSIELIFSLHLFCQLSGNTYNNNDDNSHRLIILENIHINLNSEDIYNTSI